MRRIVAVCVGCLLWAAPAVSAPAPNVPAPNVTGQLIRSAPTGCYPDQPCDPSPSVSILAFARNGVVVKRVGVGASGRFTLRLAPGLYTVRALPLPGSGRLVPSTFRVPATGTVSLRLRMR